MMRVHYEEMKETIQEALCRAGLSKEQAEVVATIHAESSLDGVYSHGLNRVPRFVGYVREGLVNVEGKPRLLKAKGFMENYDGEMGIGIMNALHCMDRAVALARVHGMGMVSLRNTTHWMRGGTYAWKAAEQGFMAMNWTNTESCMPAWGGTSQTIGNNPLCIAVPHGDAPVVLDMAMSQFSYGKLEVTRLAGALLPIPGGYDSKGALTQDPGAIEETQRILPTGYWKGSGLAVMLDLMAGVLSNGRSTADVDAYGKGSCGGASQVFIAMDPEMFMEPEAWKALVERTKHQIQGTAPAVEGQKVRYPGEGTLSTRQRNQKEGIPVDEGVWRAVQALAQA